VFLANTSISPEARVGNLVLPVVVVNSTLLESPSTAAATARHTSTSKPVQLPESSGAAKPSKPVVTPHFTNPLD
jgi:hypothetical protein